jgi:hypothetical protein
MIDVGRNDGDFVANIDLNSSGNFDRGHIHGNVANNRTLSILNEE